MCLPKLVQSRQQGGDRRDSRGPLPPADPSQYGCSSSIQIQVPNDKVGLIIGRGGSTIKSIQEKTGAHIQIPQQQDGEDPNFRTISVSASNHEAAAAAEAEINSILSGQRREPTAPQQIVMHVPNDRIGFIIGKGGATIKDIQARTRTRIQIPTDVEPNTDPPMRVVNISGVGDAPQQVRHIGHTPPAPSHHSTPLHCSWPASRRALPSR
jgi:far upstream element-binding protein